VYVRVQNRGPARASSIQVRAFWAGRRDSGYPPLQNDFWSAFPNADPADTSTWKPVGPARTIASLDPREPGIVSWDWAVPSSAPGDVRLLAAVTCAQDPISGVSGTDSAATALASRFVCVRDFDVSIAEGTVELILVVVGVAVVAGGVATAAALTR
jgi:hypothetical protein